MNMMAEFVGQYRFDLVVGVVIEQGVRKNDSPRGAQSGQRGIRLLTLLRKFPLVNSAHARSRTLAQEHQSPSQFLVFHGLKFIKDWKEHDRRELCQQNEKAKKKCPRRQPPMLHVPD